jgi:hypothetical protein
MDPTVAYEWRVGGPTIFAFAIQSKYDFLPSQVRIFGKLSSGAEGPQSHLMRLLDGQIWRCINETCGAQVRVIQSGGLEDGSNPRCSCGSIMKMPYRKPRPRRAEAPAEVKRLLEQLYAVLK